MGLDNHSTFFLESLSLPILNQTHMSALRHAASERGWAKLPQILRVRSFGNIFHPPTSVISTQIMRVSSFINI